MNTDVLQNVVVVLSRTQGPVNLGLCARACGNMGVPMRLAQPLCERESDDARKFSNHARDALLAAPVYPDLAAATADCGIVIGTTARMRESDYHGEPLAVEDVAGYLATRPAERVAIVFGNEADGLSSDELRACHAFIHLETPGPYPSYNLSHAVAVTLYAMALGRVAPARVDVAEREPAAERVHVERLERFWLETLDRFDYFRRTERLRWEPRFREFLGRLHLSHHDCDVLWGFLAQFNYKTFGDKGGHLIESPQNESPTPPNA